jgi:phospholipid transport system substrate-binding protein
MIKLGIVGAVFYLGVGFQAQAHTVNINYNVANTPSYLKQLISNEVQENSAEAFISKLGDNAISFLSNSSLSQAQKEREFRTLLTRNFDMATIGRFALGKNWRSATPAQQKEYLRLFENMVVNVYAGRFNDYQGQSFDVVSSRSSGKKDVLVTSYIIPKSGSKVQVDWRVRNKNGQNKIIDVIIEGVSMSLTQRSDFSSVIQRGGGDFNVLLAHLQK